MLRGPDKKPRIRSLGGSRVRKDGSINPDKDTGYSDERKRLRGTMEGKIGRPPENLDKPESTTPDPSEIIVEGRSTMKTWGSRKNRHEFEVFRATAEKYGLVVHEVAPGSGVTARRRWSHKRVDLSFARDTLIDAGAAGMLFDDWARLWETAQDVRTNLTRMEARKKAQVALHRLVKLDQVEKRKHPEDGRLVLYAFGKAPAEG